MTKLKLDVISRRRIQNVNKVKHLNNGKDT